MSVDGTAIDYAVVQTPGGDLPRLLPEPRDLSTARGTPTDAPTWTRRATAWAA
ncbi:MAG: hypothetical protein ACLTDR_12665 [Adlercreutzia equolifaciens]